MFWIVIQFFMDQYFLLMCQEHTSSEISVPILNVTKTIIILLTRETPEKETVRIKTHCMMLRDGATCFYVY